MGTTEHITWDWDRSTLQQIAGPTRVVLVWHWKKETNLTLQSEEKGNESHDPLISSLKKIREFILFLKQQVLEL